MAGSFRAGLFVFFFWVVFSFSFLGDASFSNSCWSFRLMPSMSRCIRGNLISFLVRPAALRISITGLSQLRMAYAASLCFSSSVSASIMLPFRRCNMPVLSPELIRNEHVDPSISDICKNDGRLIPCTWPARPLSTSSDTRWVMVSVTSFSSLL